MPRRLIYVHGINNQELTKEEIASDWSQALRGALGKSTDSWWAEVDVCTAYYADVLFKEETTWDGVSEATTRMGAGSLDSDFVPEDIASLYLEMQTVYGLSDADVEAELETGETPELARRMGAGIHKRWLKAIARALEKVVPSASDGLGRAFLRQAATYLNKPGVFEKINGLVRSQVLADLEEPSRTVVVGHSLGTIVTYVLLRAMPEQPRLPLFVTLGSPLGIGVVRARIKGPYITPPIVEKWINGSDPSDFVALRPELNSSTFGPATLINIGNLNNGYKDPHSIAKYLAQPMIAKAIGEALERRGA